MRSVLGLGFCLPLVLAGCAISPTAAPTPDTGLAIQGVVRGGQSPIIGSHVYLFAANTTGYGGPGIGPSSSNASKSLLNLGGAVLSDAVGNYVLSDGSGNFSITGDYSCTPDTQVYIYALGGNSGTGTNNSAGLLAALGNCPSTGNFQTATPYIVVNEVSTVATAYAFAGFASDATHVSSSPTATTQIKNAFANAANLANLSTGAALATTPNGNGTVPQSEIYAIADILASCVNSNGALTGLPVPACGTLLTHALASGTTGTQPTDTATAAINIAHNPGSNVGTLFGLVQGSGAFPTTFAQPNDFTIALQITGGGLNDPYSIAIDSTGSVWATNDGVSSVTKLTSAGVPVSPAGGYTASSGINAPSGIAIDLSDNAWIANYGGNNVIELSNAGGPVAAPFSATGMNGPYGIAIDGSNSVWVSGISSPYNVTLLSNTGAVQPNFPITTGFNGPRSIAIDGNGNAWIASKTALTELSVAGAQVGTSPFTGNGLNSPYAIALDHGGNAWIANEGGLTTSVSEFKSDGSAVSGSPFATGGVNTPGAIAIDGAGNAWIGNNGANTISEISATGTAISPSAGYVPDGINKCVAIAVDGSGNVWVGDPNATQLTELIGAATPVVTPLALGVKNKTLGSRP